MFAVCSLLSIVLFDMLREQARAGLLQTGAPDVWENTWAIVVSAASFAAITAVVFGVATVLYTHRITGPIYVMRRYLVDLIEGRAPQHRPLRKNDEFKDFYDVFWKAVRAVQTRKQAELDHLTGALDTARSAAQNENQGLKDALDELGTPDQRPKPGNHRPPAPRAGQVGNAIRSDTHRARRKATIVGPRRNAP